MPDYHGTRLGIWGQLYHWVKQDNGKLKFVAGLEPVAGVEFSTTLPPGVPPFILRDKDGTIPVEEWHDHIQIQGGLPSRNDFSNHQHQGNPCDCQILYGGELTNGRID